MSEQEKDIFNLLEYYGFEYVHDKLKDAEGSSIYEEHVTGAWQRMLLRQEAEYLSNRRVDYKVTLLDKNKIRIDFFEHNHFEWFTCYEGVFTPEDEDLMNLFARFGTKLANPVYTLVCSEKTKEQTPTFGDTCRYVFTIGKTKFYVPTKTYVMGLSYKNFTSINREDFEDIIKYEHKI